MTNKHTKKGRQDKRPRDARFPPMWDEATRARVGQSCRRGARHADVGWIPAVLLAFRCAHVRRLVLVGGGSCG